MIAGIEAGSAKLTARPRAVLAIVHTLSGVVAENALADVERLVLVLEPVLGIVPLKFPEV